MMGPGFRGEGIGIGLDGKKAIIKVNVRRIEEEGIFTMHFKTALLKNGSSNKLVKLGLVVKAFVISPKKTLSK